MNTRNNQSAGIFSVPGMKYFGVTFLVAIALGLYNIFSAKGASEVNNSSPQEGAVPTQPIPSYLLNLPAVPTLVPVQSNVIVQAKVEQAVASPEDAQPAPTLRVVEAPTQPPITQLKKPVVEEVVIGQVTQAPASTGNGGGGGGGGKSGGGGGKSKSSR
jgi:hypothetical protein